MPEAVTKEPMSWLLYLPEPAICLNASLRIEALNRAALELREPPMQIGQSLDTLLGEHGQKLAAALRSLGPETPSTRIEIEVGERLFRTSVQLLPESAYLLQFFDMTREKKREQFKMDILSMVAHDLRNPLAFLYMTLEMMTQSTWSLPEQTRAGLLNDCYEETDRLLKMIDDLSELSKIDAGKIEVDPEEVYVEDLIASSLISMKIFAKRSELTLYQSVPKGLPPIWGDKDKLVQILINLLSNAIKFTPTGGMLVVSASHLAAEGRDEVLVSVSDTGTGIPEAEIPGLFLKYARGSGSKTVKVKGSGLGLYIVKALVDAHKGRIEVASRAGLGSTFLVALPSARSAVASRV
jgi:two-component system, OmpR family, sensor histidine kinase VicK